MGLLEQEIKELRQMNAMLIAKKITAQEVHARIAIYSQTEKRAKMILQAYAMTAKFGEKHIKRMQSSQLLGDGSVIDIDTDVVNESIYCPIQEGVITRAGCKEFSETTGNLTECSSCHNFSVTRRLLAAYGSQKKQ